MSSKKEIKIPIKQTGKRTQGISLTERDFGSDADLNSNKSVTIIPKGRKKEAEGEFKLYTLKVPVISDHEPEIKEVKPRIIKPPSQKKHIDELKAISAERIKVLSGETDERTQEDIIKEGLAAMKINNPPKNISETLSALRYGMEKGKFFDPLKTEIREVIKELEAN